MTRLLAAAAALLVVAALIAQRDVIVQLRAENARMHTAFKAREGKPCSSPLE